MEMSRVTSAGKSSRLEIEGSQHQTSDTSIGQEPFLTLGLRAEQSLGLYIKAWSRSFLLCLMPQLQG